VRLGRVRPCLSPTAVHTVRRVRGPPGAAAREDSVIDTEPSVTCPDPTDQGACPIRTGDILFDVAVDRTDDTLYAAWQDVRFGGQRFDSIAF
jgi:hypothetical protein